MFLYHKEKQLVDVKQKQGGVHSYSGSTICVLCNRVHASLGFTLGTLLLSYSSHFMLFALVV